MDADGAFNRDWFARMTNITSRLYKVSESKNDAPQIENLRCSEWYQGSRIPGSDHFPVYPFHTLQHQRRTKMNVIHYTTAVVSLSPCVHEGAPPSKESVKYGTNSQKQGLTSAYGTTISLKDSR